eukprot:COSAG04_NODE_31936_length_254_cov_0.651613_1_plen_56_part_01
MPIWSPDTAGEGDNAPSPDDVSLMTRYVTSYYCFFKQKTAYGIMGGDWSSDVCSSD